MKNLVLMLGCVLVLWGCAATVYDNADPRADWDRDSLLCRGYAEGSTPMPQHVPVPQGRTETGYGMVNIGNGPILPYTYTQTYTPDPYAVAGAQLQNAGASWARIANIQLRYEQCLKTLGWYEVDTSAEKAKHAESERTKKKKHELYTCLVIEAHNAAKTSDNFEEILQYSEEQCEKKTGYKERNMSAYFARQAIEVKEREKKSSNIQSKK